jgi:hypothetical protein
MSRKHNSKGPSFQKFKIRDSTGTAPVAENREAESKDQSRKVRRHGQQKSKEAAKIWQEKGNR